MQNKEPLHFHVEPHGTDEIMIVENGYSLPDVRIKRREQANKKYLCLADQLLKPCDDLQSSIECAKAYIKEVYSRPIEIDITGIPESFKTAK